MNFSETSEKPQAAEQKKPPENPEASFEIDDEQKFEQYRERTLGDIKSRASQVKEDGVGRLDAASRSYELPEEDIASIRQESQIDEKLKSNSNEIDQLIQSTSEQIDKRSDTETYPLEETAHTFKGLAKYEVEMTPDRLPLVTFLRDNATLDDFEAYISKHYPEQKAEIRSKLKTAIHQLLELKKSIPEEEYPFSDVEWGSVEEVIDSFKSKAKKNEENPIAPSSDEIEQDEIEQFGRDKDLLEWSSQVLPPSWLEKIKYIRYAGAGKDSSDISYSGHAIMSTDSNGMITIYDTARFQTLNNSFASLIHEISHNNDWRNNNYPLDFRIELFKRVRDRIFAQDRLKDAGPITGETLPYLDSQGKNKLPPHLAQDAIIEYWAELSTAYMLETKQVSESDRALLQYATSQTDPGFIVDSGRIFESQYKYKGSEKFDKSIPTN